jgi:hypothetical protein
MLPGARPLEKVRMSLDFARDREPVERPRGMGSPREASFARTPQRRVSARGTRPQDGHPSEWVPGRGAFQQAVKTA